MKTSMSAATASFLIYESSYATERLQFSTFERFDSDLVTVLYITGNGFVAMVFEVITLFTLSKDKDTALIIDIPMMVFTAAFFQGQI